MLNVMRRLTLPLIATLWLSACATAGSNPGAACPPPVDYSADFQKRLANEIEALPVGAALERAMLDYGRERAELRACRGAKS